MRYVLAMFICVSALSAELEPWQIEAMQRDHLSVPPILVGSKPALPIKIEIAKTAPAVMAEVVEIEIDPPTARQLELMREYGLSDPPKINGEFPNQHRKVKPVAAKPVEVKVEPQIFFPYDEKARILEDEHKTAIEKLRAVINEPKKRPGVIDTIEELKPISDEEMASITKMSTRIKKAEPAKPIDCPTCRLQAKTYAEPVFCPECHARSRQSRPNGRGPTP